MFLIKKKTHPDKKKIPLTIEKKPKYEHPKRTAWSHNERMSQWELTGMMMRNHGSKQIAVVHCRAGNGFVSRSTSADNQRQTDNAIPLFFFFFESFF